MARSNTASSGFEVTLAVVADVRRKVGPQNSRPKIVVGPLVDGGFHQRAYL